MIIKILILIITNKQIHSTSTFLKWVELPLVLKPLTSNLPAFCRGPSPVDLLLPFGVAVAGLGARWGQGSYLLADVLKTQGVVSAEKYGFGRYFLNERITKQMNERAIHAHSQKCHTSSNKFFGKIWSPCEITKIKIK